MAQLITAIVLFLIPSLIIADDSAPIPSDKSQLDGWFTSNVQSLSARKGTLDPALEAAESNATVIKVRQDGSGDFKTIADAVNSIPQGNSHRIIVSVGPGTYNEKVKIERNKPFVTLYGDPNNVPTMVFDGAAWKYTIVESATLIVESDYFSAVNFIFVNSAPRPDGTTDKAQAAAFKIGGEKASFYNCKFHGFQDTLLDDLGKHFFKDCYVEGTVDFIFGNGKSIYLNTEIHVFPGDQQAFIAAQARHNAQEDTGFSFVHCTITGTGGNAMLARSWFTHGTVVFAYTEMSDVINPAGWDNGKKPETESTVYFGEYNNKGAGATPEKRAAFSKKLSDTEVKPFITLAWIEGSKWLLPPAQV